jgi:multicomponent Na+:H+ antiporter subunit C
METVLAIVIGCLFAAGFYSMLRRSIVKLVIGIILLSNAINLLIFTASGLTRGRPPLVIEGANALAQPHADPLPQALILTAIVIGFGVLAFILVLVHCVHQTIGTDDIDEMKGINT